MDNVNWRLWCRLCAKMDTVNSIRMHLKDESFDIQCDEEMVAKNLSMAHAIERFFLVKFNQSVSEEGLPNLLCMDCVSLITSLENFANRVSRVQEMFDSLNWTTESIDFDAVRLNFGVLDGEHFVLTKELKPELHCFSTEQQTTLFQEVVSPKNLETEDPLQIVSQIKREKPLDDALPLEHEIERKDNDGIDYDDVDNVKSLIDSSDSYEEMERKKPSKNKRKTKKISKSKSKDKGSDAQTCTECHKKYKCIHQHMKRAHSIILPPTEYPCTECGLVFKSIYRLKDHKKVHTHTELRIPCLYCDKIFISNLNANCHMRQFHKKKLLHTCEQCGLNLSSQVSLRLHMLTHSGLNPFICDVCGRGFKSIYMLKLHMDAHSDTNFPCQQCGHEFKTRIALRRHLPSHSEVKRFICNVCERAFKRRKTLKNHLIMHTGLKLFKCNFCDRSFSTGSSCRLHKRTMHTEELAAFESDGKVAPMHNIPTLAELRAMKMPSNLNNPT